MRMTHHWVREMNWPLVAVMAVIGLLGVYNLHSSAAARDPQLFLTQLALLGAGGVMIAALLTVDYRVTESIAYPAFAITCLLLVAVLLQGKTAGGAQRWLVVGPLTFQPSEIAKLATILCLARYFSQRVRPDGYSMRALFRPLNLSRPLATIGVLAVGWNKPWLVDPIGEAARFIRGKLDGVEPVAADLMWFRVLLIAGLIAACSLTLFLIVRSARQRALLDPWPPGRRNRLIMLSVMLYLVLGAGLASVWNVPTVRDPFGVMVAGLSAAAAPGGVYEMLHPGLTLRIGLVLAAALYLAASIFALRQSAAPLVDLVIAPIDLLIIPALLVLVEPDLGTAGIIVLIGFTMILVVGVRLRTLIILGVMGACVAAIGWFGVLKDYQKTRIITFIDPEHDIQGAGWNAVQSMIAVGSGRWTGKGHMGGTQSQLSFLPEQHTDFAFSVWAEEQGFVGCLLVLALFLLLLVLALSIAANAREAYGALLATGVVAMIFWQALINVGMVIGALPVVGMPLPLFSYGGSSLMTVLLGAGLLLNVHMRRRSH